MPDSLPEAIRVLTATCPKCNSIVAGHVIGSKSDDKDIGRIVREGSERGYTIAVVNESVSIGPCNCDARQRVKESLDLDVMFGPRVNDGRGWR